MIYSVLLLFLPCSAQLLLASPSSLFAVFNGAGTRRDLLNGPRWVRGLSIIPTEVTNSPVQSLVLVMSIPLPSHTLDFEIPTHTHPRPDASSRIPNDNNLPSFQRLR